MEKHFEKGKWEQENKELSYRELEYLRHLVSLDAMYYEENMVDDGGYRDRLLDKLSRMTDEDT